jgi:predicted site-specific integrase-resolvase
VNSPNENTNNDRLLNRKEAAMFLGLSPKTLAMWHSTKRIILPVTKIGRRVFYKQSILKKFIDDNTGKT